MRGGVSCGLAARGKSHGGAKNGGCHQFASHHDPRNTLLSLKRIGWLYPIFSDLRFYHGPLAYVLALVAVFATPPSLRPSESDASRIAQILRDAGRSLEAGNAASFLFYFDRNRFADYSALESDVDALTRHSEIASSTEVTNVEAEGEAYLVEVDWILRLRPISAFGGIDTRRKLLKLRFERIKDRWKIVKLQPIEFFRAR